MKLLIEKLLYKAVFLCVVLLTEGLREFYRNIFYVEGRINYELDTTSRQR